MNCYDVSKRYNVGDKAVRVWAANNGVSYTGEGNRKTYQWTEGDCVRFAARPSKGRPKSKNLEK
jgi:hypothetical protein